MGNIVKFKQTLRPSQKPEDVIRLLQSSIDTEARAYWRFLSNLNELLGHDDIPAELPGWVGPDDMGDLMEKTYERVRQIKENAYQYHLAMCEKEGR